MTRLNLSSLIFVFFLFTGLSFGQDIEVIVQEQLDIFAPASNLAPADVENWRITDNHISQQSGLWHIYIRQQYQGLDIIGANAGLHLDTKVKDFPPVSFNSQFIRDAASNIANANVSTNPQLTASQAVESAAAQLGYRTSEPIVPIKVIEENRNILLSDGGISLEDIPAKLVYQANSAGAIKLAWDISILELGQQNWWSIRVDASNGQILAQDNWIVSCNWGTPHNHNHHNCTEEHFSKHHTKIPSLSKFHEEALVGSYNVYALPVESPLHGNRSIVTDPEDLTASPYGWHDTNGTVGAEYTITRGNNVHAQEDRNGNNGTGYSPDGGAALNFNFTLDLSMAPATNEDAMITNLFYWNNIIHDVAYRYGFDEVSGNFQANNYGRGGRSGDYVLADAQDGGGTNNANFGTPPDGSNPRMQMFLWTTASPNIDGDLDNGIILHEYGHGISNRLTGGPNTTSCLNNTEQMGEGWSDYFGLMLTMEPTDQGIDRRGIGNYALNQNLNQSGIRQYPYTTDMAVNPHTYANVSGVSVPHGVGSVWCAMLWEMTWGLIEEHGFDNNFYAGNGGNNISMQLVMDGMKLQTCSPGFVDGRDAILQADTALYGGANSCIIWKAFAKRGLGFSADQGSSGSVSDGTQAFDLPPGVNEDCSSNPLFAMVINPSTSAACPGENIQFDVSLLSFNGYSGTVNLTATGLPAGVSSAIAPNSFSSFPATATWTISNTNGVTPSDYVLQLNGNDGDTTIQKQATIQILPTAAAPTLNSPSNAATVTSLVQQLVWNEAAGATSYDLQLATDVGFSNLVIDQAGVNGTSFTTDLLTPNTTYYWRVRSNSCAPSSYSTVFSFSTISVCGQSFTDSGGPNGNYDNNELIQWIFCPDNEGESVRVTFSSFNVEVRSGGGCWDHLTVYDGNSTNATLIGQFCGTTLADAPGGGSVSGTSENGCLTFVFDSDVSVTPAGWEAEITCLGCPAPVISDVSISPENCSGTSDGQVTISATGSGTLEYVLTPESGSPTINNTGTFSNLSGGAYSVVARLQSDPTCVTAPYDLTLPTITPTIVEIDIIGRSCDGAADASVMIIADYQNSLEYLLTPIGESTQINTTGIFNNLTGGQYTITLRATDANACVSTDSTIIIPIDVPISTTPYELCFNGNMPASEGLLAACTDNICNKMTTLPNKVINASNTQVCETFTISGHTESVSEIFLSFKVEHTWVGDLSATLQSPDGTTVTLFDAPGIPGSTYGCHNNNMNVILTDTAAMSAAALEGMCQTSVSTETYAIEGSFQPVQSFSTFNGESANGVWTFCINDNFAGVDHGVLREVTFIVNPVKPTVTWWDAPTNGNLLHTGAMYNPVEDGLVRADSAATYSFWAACQCLDCPSERSIVDFVVNNQNDGTAYYADEDRDTYGDAANEVIVCPGDIPPANYVTNALDCNDNDAAINPDATEIVNNDIDEDCDGEAQVIDDDNDGYNSAIDCDDSNPNDTVLVINNNPIAAGEYLANASISSIGRVASGTNSVLFQAADFIILNPGFSVEQTGEFMARIDSCGEVPNSLTIVPQSQLKQEIIIEHNMETDKPLSAIGLSVFPNPFQNQTNISIQLSQRAKVNLSVFNNFGQLIKKLSSEDWQDAGSHSFVLDSQNITEGIYFIVLRTDEHILTEKIVLSK